VALAGPTAVDDGYQLFANGALIGSFGDFSGKTPTAGITKPMFFSISQDSLPQGAGISGTTATSLVLAFRMWMDPTTLVGSPDVGGFHTAPVLGSEDGIRDVFRLEWLAQVLSTGSNTAFAVGFVALALLVFSLKLFDPSDSVYLWVGGVLLLQAGVEALHSAVSWTNLNGITWTWMTDVLNSFIYAGWLMVWWVWFGRPRPAWLRFAVFGLAALNLISTLVAGSTSVISAPTSVTAAFYVADVVSRILLFSTLIWIVVLGIRRQGVEGWLVLPAVILFGVGLWAPELVSLNVPFFWYPFGVGFTMWQVIYVALVVTLTLLLLRRLLRSLERQRLMALDVKQAQEVQQVILPEARLVLPGLVIESEYRPAREVGGDFFQIIPNGVDGSLLIVAGDVTGKGLKAGMLVALLVGAIRTAAEVCTDPDLILRTLNKRLLGRSQAQATCLALTIAKDGEVVLANAGHVPPYRNKEAIAMEGALPLGMVDGAEPSVMRFQLIEGDTLVLISDGVVEATDANKRLFGFERVAKLLETAGTAAEIASAAQEFGQEDDVSVIYMTRTARL
jgi:sulfur transfer complex TusBCD TusB component (DsrH family)